MISVTVVRTDFSKESIPLATDENKFSTKLLYISTTFST